MEKKLSIVELHKSETYPDKKFSLKTVYTDNYIDMLKNMKIKKNGLLTLSEAKPHINQTKL